MGTTTKTITSTSSTPTLTLTPGTPLWLPKRGEGKKWALLLLRGGRGAINGRFYY